MFTFHFSSNTGHWVLSSIFTCIQHTKNQFKTESFCKDKHKKQAERIFKYKHTVQVKKKPKTN